MVHRESTVKSFRKFVYIPAQGRSDDSFVILAGKVKDTAAILVVANQYQNPNLRIEIFVRPKICIRINPDVQSLPFDWLEVQEKITCLLYLLQSTVQQFYISALDITRLIPYNLCSTINATGKSGRQ